MRKINLLLLFVALISITSCKESKQKVTVASLNKIELKEVNKQSYEGLWVQVDPEGNFIDANIITITKSNEQFLVEIALNNQKGSGLFSINDNGILSGKINFLGSLNIDRIKHIDKKLNGAMSVIITDTPDVIEIGLFKQKDALNQ